MSMGLLAILVLVVGGGVGLIAVATIATILFMHRRGGRRAGDEVDSSK